jgi:hypothetical protein
MRVATRANETWQPKPGGRNRLTKQEPNETCSQRLTPPSRYDKPSPIHPWTGGAFPTPPVKVSLFCLLVESVVLPIVSARAFP